MVCPRRTRALPPNPSIEQHKKQAKELLKAHRSGDPEAADRLRSSLPRLASLSAEAALASPLTLSDAQFVIAREHGFESWPKFQRHVEAQAAAYRARVNEFLTAATSDPYADHRAGTEEAAALLLASCPELPIGDIYAAATVGDSDAVGRLLQQDRTLAIKKGGPHDWEPLQYVCFSRFLRRHPERTEEFVRTARLLLEQGANPNASFESNGEIETVLYGAGGVARNPALMRLLLESGADPNDGDLEYHAAEYPDASCLMLLVEFGLDLNRTGTSLLRKLDFEEIENVRWLLEAGARPDAGLAAWGKTAIHQAILRGRSLDIVRLLISYGADVDARTKDGKTAYALAVRRGRTDVADLLREHGAKPELDPSDRLIAACARADTDEVSAILAANPGLVGSLSPADMGAIVDAAGAGKTAAVRTMLDAGFPVDGPRNGEATPLHQAAWNAHADTAALLLERGASTDALDKRLGGTPLGWALHAATNAPGAPDRHADVIRLLRSHGAHS